MCSCEVSLCLWFRVLPIILMNFFCRKSGRSSSREGRELASYSDVASLSGKLIFPYQPFFLAGCECFGHSFVYVAHFVILRDAWIRTQRAAAARRCANNLATHLPISNYPESRNQILFFGSVCHVPLPLHFQK